MTSTAKSFSLTSTRRLDVADAFLPDTTGQARPLPEEDAESDAEEFVASALFGESMNEAARDEVVDEEEGGPFIVLDDDGSLPHDGDESDADREGSAAIQREHAHRAALWAARGR